MSFWSNATNQNLIPIKHTSRLNPDVLSESTDPEYEFDYIDIGSVTLEAGIEQREKIRFGAAPSRARKPVREGDVIVSTVRTYLKAVAYIGAIDDGSIVSTGFAVLRPNGRIDPRFLYRVIQSNPFVETVQAESTGVSYPTINPSALGSLKIPLPDLDDQKVIAAFLDRETARIDQLIEKKGRQVALLNAHAKQTVSELLTGLPLPGQQTTTTGLDFIPRVPAHWTLRRAGLLFQQVAEPNFDDLPILSVSIHQGISDRQLDDDERDRKVNLMADRSSYKRVRPGYLAYNMMRAWQGAVGVSTVEGAVSPAYVVAKPTLDLHSLYYQFLLRTLPFIEQMRQRSKGITDFRLRLYWEQFRQILLPVPPLGEQQRIAGEAEKILSRAAKLASMVTASVERLKERRSALITAAVTGQIDVRGRATVIETKPDRARFRVMIGAEIVHSHQGNPKFGRVKLQKELYLAEAHVGISEVGGNYLRYAAGPYDEALIQETEQGLETAGFYRAEPANRDRRATHYAPLANAGLHTDELKALLGSRVQDLQTVIALLRDFDKDAVEAIATLYAVWNDSLMDGNSPDDTAIIRGFLTEWHRDKERFKDEQLRHWLAWMRRNGLVPRGNGPRTSHTMTQDMFAK